MARRSKDLNEPDFVEITKNIIQGKSSKYEQEYHCELLIRLFSEGNDTSAFCSQSNITRPTFYNWIDKYPAFKESYEIAKEKARTWFETAGRRGMLDPLNFNVTAWSIQMRNRFGTTEHRKVKVPLDENKSLMENMAEIFKMTNKGELTGKELNEFSNLLLSAAKLYESTEVKNRLEKLEEDMKESKGVK